MTHDRKCRIKKKLFPDLESQTLFSLLFILAMFMTKNLVLGRDWVTVGQAAIRAGRVDFFK